MAFQAQISGKNKSNRVSSHKLLQFKGQLCESQALKICNINHFNTISANFIHTHIKNIKFSKLIFHSSFYLIIVVKIHHTAVNIYRVYMAFFICASYFCNYERFIWYTIFKFLGFFWRL